MRLGRRLLGQTVKGVAAAADVVRRPAPGLVVLIYHRVGGGTTAEIDLPVPAFDTQMAWLAEHRRPVTLDEGLDLVADDQPGHGPPPIVVTFDDGTADFVDHALPVLDRHRIPATLYVATDFVERQRRFPPDAPAVTWAGLAEALTSGWVTVGSHTHTHALLDRLPEVEVADELDRSVELIGERLGVRAEHFAYPKAVPGSPAAEDALRRRFRSAALAGTRVNPYGATDPHRLARSPVQVSDGATWFHRKAAGGMALEDTLRDVINRRRYAEATT